MAQSNILLESGTNELEVLEFVIAGNSFGINVAKVTELMQAQKIQKMPNSHPMIEGVFQPRNEVYTLLNLPLYLNLPISTNPDKDIYIITNFNRISIAFHVHAVESIHRISWQEIEKPDSIIYGGFEGVVTGIAKVGNRIISILDFEKITYDVSPETGVHMDEVLQSEMHSASDYPILIAEDSPLLRRMIQEALKIAGYTHVIMTTNGEEAWRFLTDIKEHADVPIMEQVRLVITDIEMPRMDGHKLIKLVNSDPVLKQIPVIIFSSLIDAQMEIKGREVGASAQLSKPDIGKLVGMINEIIKK